MAGTLPGGAGRSLRFAAVALLDTLKQKVLDLGRGEARSKARPLLIDDESFDRSAAGLDRRVQEGFVLFWLLSDQALFLVAGGSASDSAFRVPFEAVAEVTADYDENSDFLPWYFRLTMHADCLEIVTTLEEQETAANPLAPAVPRALSEIERTQFARGELIPLTGFAALPEKFRTALGRSIESAGGSFSVSGAEAAERQRRAGTRPKRSKTGDPPER